MEVITSKSNEKVKYLKNLNDRKFRIEYNAFYLEGIKVIDEILKNKKAVNIKFIAYSSEILSLKNGGKELLESIKKIKDIECINFSKFVFEYITDTKTPQGIIAVLDIPKYDLEQELKDEKKNIILLDKVQDLGNMGTIVRNCSAFDIDSIICIKGTADMYSNKVTRSTMGTILDKKIFYIEDIDKLFSILKKYNFNVIGASLDTNKYLEDYDFSCDKYCFVFGNEANGISREILEKCNETVKISMLDKTDSLNVSVANAILLYKQFIDKKLK